MLPQKLSLQTLALASLLTCFSLLGQSAPAEAGCGCNKLPPAAAEVRPQATYAGTEVSLFHPGLQVGQIYTVTFTSGITGESATAQAQAVTRRDLADGQYKPQVVVSLPKLPLGPTSLSLSLAGQSDALMFISDDHFTVAPQPLVISQEVGEYHLPSRQAAVSRAGVVYLSLDVSNVTLPRTFKAQAQGYPLRFTHEDVMFYNVQGFVMQQLDDSIPGLFSLQTANSTTDSNTLHYSRHEFNTFFLQHEERQPHEVDAEDPNWHLDNSPHIDHDHLLAAIAGYLNNGSVPAPGATPSFELVLHSFSLFHHGLVGDAYVDMGGTTDSYNSKDGLYGSEGDILSNGEVKLTGKAVVDGDATGFVFDISKNVVVTGEIIVATEPTEFMPVDIPDSLENLGKIEVTNNDTLTLGPGSYQASEVKVSGDGQLFIDNSAGPVTLYVTGKVDITGKGGITAYDPDPEKFALYVAGGSKVKLAGNGTFHGVVYAPESLLDISGNGEFFGSFVGNEVESSANAYIHYDTALRGE
jgi:hypothetical protein